MTEPDWLQAEREYEDEVIGQTTLPHLFEEQAKRHADADAQWYKGGIYDRSLAPEVVPEAPDGEFAALTYREMRDVVRHLAAGFRELGVAADDRVGIYADTRMEWAQADLGILAAGGVVTTVYTESSPQRVQYLLDDPGATGVVVENADLLETLLEVEDELDLGFVVVIDEVGPEYASRDDVYTLGEVHEMGADAWDVDAYESWINDRDPDDLASLIYTSGTTGKPKGVQLTHRNFRANVNGIRKRFGPRPDKDEDTPIIDSDTRSLSFLPLAHVYERTAGHFVMFASGATVAYAESTDTVQEDLQTVKPNGAASVPRVYERIHDAMMEQASESPVKERIFSWATDVAREWATTEEPDLALRAKHAVADRLVFSTVREELGGEVEAFQSGGGSISADLVRMFQGMGIRINEGYGLTETAPVVSTNPAEDSRPGTLGPPLVNVDVKLDETVVSDDHRENADGPVGELLVKGPNVTQGYWNRPEATEEAFTEDVPGSGATGESSDSSDGRWFRTGDIIEMGDDGYLIYHDRLKQVLVLDTGKNVAPQPIEDEFATSDRVEQIMVVGDDEKFLAALVVPNLEAARRWADNQGLPLPDDPAEICDDDRVRQWVGEEIERVNATLPKSHRIREFRLVPTEWTAENDLLTPSMKKKRRDIRDEFAEELDDIYGRAEQEAAADD